MIKAELVSKHETSEILKAEGMHNTEIASTSSRVFKRSHSPDAHVTGKKPRMSDFMAQQNLVLEKLFTSQTSSVNTS